TWQRTNVTPDANNQIEEVIYVQAPHNPTDWEDYLTKPTYDDSKHLTWSDLELIDTAGDVYVDAEKLYRIQVNLPVDSSGDA
ncbi:lytic polysaccharide monooxygenase, partial [Vibrio parahaemolyticus]|nr:lytic polysaccharide monooxygenase [Vibrio parahaemolyticus]